MESLAGDPQAFSASAEDYQSLSLEEVRKRLGSGKSDFLVAGAFEGSRLVGMAGFHREAGQKVRHKGRIWGVYVTPASRGKGVGRKLLCAVMQRGAEIEGIEQILISVATTQTAAICLYRSLGFRSFGCEPRALLVGGRFIDEEYMIYLLKPSRTAP